MVRRGEEQQVTRNEQMRGGDGTVVLTRILDADELYGKGRLFSVITLEPGTSIGPHTHEGEMECFYLMRGECVLDDNGTEVVLHPGDTALTRHGERHSIANRGAETAELVALILYR